MIEGKIINLRPMESSDVELFYKWMTNQEYLGEYMDAEMQYKDVCTENMKKGLSSSHIFFMIIENKEGTPIGLVNYLDSIASKVSIDFGMLIADKSYRGCGVGGETVGLLTNYLFNTKNIMRIQFMTRSDNEGMKALGQKSGFKLDGVLRKYSFDSGEYRDMCLFGMTRDDWKEQHK